MIRIEETHVSSQKLEWTFNNVDTSIIDRRRGREKSKNGDLINFLSGIDRYIGKAVKETPEKPTW